MNLTHRPAASRSLFVIGTDTGVGKTRVCAALLRGLAARGLRAVGMKPVAAGATRDAATGQWCNEDTTALRAASGLRVPASLDNPVLLPDPLSPHLTAQRAGVRISLDAIIRAHRELAARADAVVIEGAGGFLVPLAEREDGTLLTGADLAVALEMPLLLVVGLRLGCLNHTLLTVEALRARGLRLHGWVANTIDPHMACLQENIEFLQRQVPAPLLARLAHGESPILDIGWPA